MTFGRERSSKTRISELFFIYIYITALSRYRFRSNSWKTKPKPKWPGFQVFGRLLGAEKNPKLRFRVSRRPLKKGTFFLEGDFSSQRELLCPQVVNRKSETPIFSAKSSFCVISSCFGPLLMKKVIF